MAILPRDQKKDRRIARLVSPLMNRRAFVTAMTLAGSALTSPVAFGKNVKRWNEALEAAYWVMWGAADGEIEGHINSPLDGVMDQFDPTMNDPYSEDVDTQNYNARQWFIWRLKYAFKKKMGPNDNPMEWDRSVDYVLLNAARTGSLARRFSVNSTINKLELRQAFHVVKIDPLDQDRRRGTAQTKQDRETRDVWCL
jgi:hypothetical protein